MLADWIDAVSAVRRSREKRDAEMIGAAAFALGMASSYAPLTPREKVPPRPKNKKLRKRHDANKAARKARRKS